MSTQLILYPQHHNGQYNFTSISSANSFLVDGLNFSSLNTSSSHDSATILLDSEAINALAPLTVNTWYRLRYPDTAPPALPVESGGNLVFNSIATQTYSGVFQRLSSLTIGQAYDVTVTVASAGVGRMLIRTFTNPPTLIESLSVFDPTPLTFTHTFTATATDSIVMLLFNHTGVDNVTVNTITITPQGISPSLAYNDLQDGQVIVDLYENEDIPLTLSVDDFKNVAEKVQSYSKAFNLPATKRNNQIFDNVFDITRSDDGIVFNPYVKTQCCLKQDGFILFEGYLRLLDIQDKEGEISYNINLYSEVIALADVLKELTFANLDFTELEHSYDKANIKYSWNDGVTVGQTTPITWLNSGTSGFRTDFNTLKYPFIDWNHDILIANGFTGSGATHDMPELTSLESAFRPCINIKYLIDRIFNQPSFPFTYTSDFFSTDADFNKLYMDFNWGAQSTIIEGTGTYTGTGTNTSTTSFATLWLDDTDFSDEFGYNTSNYNFVAAEDATTYTFDYAFPIYMTSSDDLSVRWQQYNASGTVIDVHDAMVYASGGITAGSYVDYVGSFTANLNQNDTIQPMFKTASAGTGTQGVLSWAYDTYVNATVGAKLITGNVLLQTLRGELAQWDFLKGLMTMFNLVSVPDKSNPNNILIEPYADIFISNTSSGTTSDLTLASRSITHDWTEKIDVAEVKLLPLTDLNKTTIFKFVEDEDDYAFNVYKNSVFGHLYGSKVYDASGFTVLQGEEEIIAEPFAATLPKMLMTQFPQLVTPAIYSYNPDDGTSEGFDNSPRILYNNGKVTMSTDTYFIPSHNGLSSENQPDYLQFTHLGAVPAVVSIPPAITDTQDFHFGECQLMSGMGNSTSKNLFNVYWLPYFAELYNPDTRIMTIKVNLTAGDVNAFNFYDTVFIKNRQYRVNKIDYKPNDLATVEFILIP